MGNGHACPAELLFEFKYLEWIETQYKCILAWFIIDPGRFHRDNFRDTFPLNGQCHEFLTL